jgi:hypothetical protein
MEGAWRAHGGHEGRMEVARLSADIPFLILTGNAFDAVYASMQVFSPAGANWRPLLQCPAHTRELLRALFHMSAPPPPPPTRRLPPASLAVPPGTSPGSSVVDQAASPLSPARPIVQSLLLDSSAALPAHLPPPPPQPSPPPTDPVGQSPAGGTDPPVALPPPPLPPPRSLPRGWPELNDEGQDGVLLSANRRSLIIAAIEATRAAQAALAPSGHMLHLVFQFPALPVASEAADVPRASCDVVPLASPILWSSDPRIRAKLGCAYRLLALALAHALEEAKSPATRAATPPSWQTALKDVMAPDWFPSAGLAASSADKSAEPLSNDVPDEVLAACEPPPTCKWMLSSAHAKYASIMLELFFSRLQWKVLDKGDAAARVPPPIMREWTPPSAWVSLGSVDIVTSEFDLQDHEFRAKGTAAHCVVRPSRVRTASQRVAALAVMTFIANETAGGRVVLDSLIRESKDERSEMRARARAAVVSEKQKQKKGDAAAAAAAPTPLTNGGGESAKARSRAPRRGGIRPPPKRRRLSSSLAPSAEAEVGGTAAVVAAAAAVASAVAAPDMGALQHPENLSPTQHLPAKRQWPRMLA